MSSRVLVPEFKCLGAPGSDVGTNAATHEMSLNNFPTVTFGAFPGSEGKSLAPPISDAMKLAGQAQQHGGEGTVNIKTSLNDGTNSLSFQGMHTAPRYSLGVQDVGLTFSGVHEAAGICNLNMSIYSPDSRDGSWGRLDFTKVKGSIPERILKISTMLITEWQRVQAISTEDSIKKVFDQMHEANSAPYNIFTKIMGASKNATIKDLDEALSAHTRVNEMFNAYLARILVNRTNNFWTIITKLCATFGFVYVPSLGAGEFGQLAAYSTIWDNVGSLTVPVTNITMQLGSVVISPISHVIMYRSTDPDYKIPDPRNKIMPNEGVEAFVRYPENATGGRPMTIPIPDFLTYAMPRASTSPKSFGGKTLGMNNFSTDKKALEKSFAEQFESVQNICKSICKQTFLDVSLADSTATLSVPLDVTLKCGQMLEISAEGGGKLFRGLLRGVSHYLQSHPSPAASTTLAFSHVQAGDYRQS